MSREEVKQPSALRLDFVVQELEDLLKEFSDQDAPLEDFDVTDYARTIADRWTAEVEDT